MTNYVEHLFMYVLAICVHLWKNVQILCPFFNGFVWLFAIVFRIFYMLWVLTPYQMYDLQVRSPVCSAASSAFDGVLC